MEDETVAVDLGEVVHVLRLARDGWPKNRGDWTTDGFTSAVWNGFIAQDDAMGLTDEGRAFLGKVGRLYPDGAAVMTDIRTQRFVVEVSASIMPRMTERELHDVVARLAFEKESKCGMGALGVHVHEVSPYDDDECEYRP